MTRLTLETDAGLIPLKITSHNGRVERVLTGMKLFVDERYSLGIQPITGRMQTLQELGSFSL